MNGLQNPLAEFLRKFACLFGLGCITGLLLLCCTNNKVKEVSNLVLLGSKHSEVVNILDSVKIVYTEALKCVRDGMDTVQTRVKFEPILSSLFRRVNLKLEEANGLCINDHDLLPSCEKMRSEVSQALEPVRRLAKELQILGVRISFNRDIRKSQR